FTFEKFPQASDTLGPQMKSVGEAMAIGRTFKESFQKAMRSLEIGSSGFEPRPGVTDHELRERLRVPWFLRHVDEILAEERALEGTSLAQLTAERLRTLKQEGFSDLRLAELLGTTEDEVRARRTGAIEPVYKTVDTCGAEFVAHTPYLYSTFEDGDDESRPDRGKKKIVILGG